MNNQFFDSIMFQLHYLLNDFGFISLSLALQNKFSDSSFNKNNAELKEYKKFLINIEPISKSFSNFSFISKTYSFGRCKHCYNKFEYYLTNNENQKNIDINIT